LPPALNDTLRKELGSTLALKLPDPDGSTLIKDGDLNVRKGFVQKVYAIITVQLLFTSLLSIFAMATITSGFGAFLIHNTWTLILMLVVNIATMIAVFCFRSMARTVPTNYILLSLFTFSEAWLVATVCASYQQAGLGNLVLMAALMTCGMTFALTLYACTTKTDFTLQGGALFIFSCVVTLFVIFELFTNNPTFHVIVSLAVVVLYGFYLLYDTQLIIGGKTYELSIDDYILGAIIIYVDIVVLFLRILEILSYFFGNRNGN